MLVENHLQNKSRTAWRELLFAEWRGPHRLRGGVPATAPSFLLPPNPLFRDRSTRVRPGLELWCAYSSQGVSQGCKFPSFIPGVSDSLNLGLGSGRSIFNKQPR